MMFLDVALSASVTWIPIEGRCAARADDADELSNVLPSMYGIAI